jgi:hypothetical protein
MTSQKRNIVATCLTAASLLASSAPAGAASSSCWSPAEASALKVRQMQVFLMVSALQCTVRGDKQMRSAYNRFAQNSRAELQDNAAVLKARFMADHGSSGGAQFDQYLTRLANNFSADPSASADCARVASLASDAAGQNAAGLAALAHQLFPEPDRTLACTSPARLAGLKID